MTKQFALLYHMSCSKHFFVIDASKEACMPMVVWAL